MEASRITWVFFPTSYETRQANHLDKGGEKVYSLSKALNEAIYVLPTSPVVADNA